MNYVQELATAGAKASRARLAANQAESERDSIIRQANYHGGMSVRDISGRVGISHQRVAQIISANPILPTRLKLHEAMVSVLRDFATDWVPVAEVARLITARGLYARKDRTPLAATQVRARAAKYPHLFVGSTDGTNRIRLRET